MYANSSIDRHLDLVIFMRTVFKKFAVRIPFPRT